MRLSEWSCAKPGRAALIVVSLAAVAFSGAAYALVRGEFGCMMSWQATSSAPDSVAVAGSTCSAGLSTVALLGWPSYVVLACAAFVLMCLFAAKIVYGGRARVVARWAGVGSAFAGAAALVMIPIVVVAPGRNDVTQALALLMWAGTLPAIVLTVIVTVTVVFRVMVRADRYAEFKGFPPTPGAPGDLGPIPPVQAIWAGNYSVPSGRNSSARPTGICLSGGGIRSGTFAMGAMQAFAQGGLLARADYLATVSGGGYLGGSHQMLRSRAQFAGTPVRRKEAFAPGSPEEDHVRRHGKYIADGAMQWVAAIGLVVRNVLLGLGLVFAVLLVVSRLLGWIYAQVAPWSRGLFVDAQCMGAEMNGFPCVWAWPDYPRGTWIAVGSALGLALLTWVLSGWSSQRSPSKPRSAGERPKLRNVLHTVLRELLLRPRDRGSFEVRTTLQRVAGGLLVLGVAVGMLAVGIPALGRAAVFLAQGRTGWAPPEVGSVVGLVTAAVTLWNMVGRKNSSKVTPAQPLRQRVLAGAGFATRALLSALVVLGLLAVAMMIVGAGVSRAVVDFLPAAAGGRGLSLLTDWWLWALVLMLVIVSIVFDQSRMSLHPFYKRRLASAFNLRRQDGRAEEVEWGDPSSLSTLAAPVMDDDGQGRLQLVLCAAANLSGQDLVPPGRRVTPFVFTSDYIGGPRLGYVETAALERLLDRRTYRSDITVLAAMSVSGAAFASAMGRMSGPFDVLLALSNARLGVWLPNPLYLRRWFRDRNELGAPLDRWRNPLPQVRRLMYYARELLGVYSPDDRFVYVSDGGHYDNLGLLELLRRKCRTVYCVDASGDGAIAQTLAEAALLAYEELGVRLTVDGNPLAPNSADDGTAPNQQFRELQRRLSTCSVVTGEIHYPEVAGVSGVGRLVFGKAVLTPQMSFPLQAHAARDQRFPGDSTADQWFDVDQFDAYQSLGRLVGAAMVETTESAGPAEGPEEHEASIQDSPALTEAAPSLNPESAEVVAQRLADGRPSRQGTA